MARRGQDPFTQHPSRAKQSSNSFQLSSVTRVEIFRQPMADIALLVAEDSEKRIKRGAPGAGEEASKGRGNFEFEGTAKACGSWAESAAAAAAGVKAHVAPLVKAEPKTPFAVAAFDGFFSA
uniref:Uncharacterized protein n=1 Tax=Avena sativa TaxID=4498 RepID=A0ACD5TUA4_AVESA